LTFAPESGQLRSSQIAKLCSAAPGTSEGKAKKGKGNKDYILAAYVVDSQ
jgi:hypothetical protein